MSVLLLFLLSCSCLILLAYSQPLAVIALLS